MVHWVEKASLEKIRWVLEISEQERHYKILLTPKNLADVRWNPASYSLPIIPHPLPSEVVDGEHFITVDLLNLIAGSASSSRVRDAETLSRELVSQTMSGSFASTSGDSGSTQPAPSRGERGYCPESLPLLRKGTISVPRVLNIKNGGTTQRRNVPRAQVKDFIPWVRPDSSRLADLEEEEEEEEMTGLLDRYATRKRKRQESSERENNQAEGSNRPIMDGGSEMEAIVILSSLEMGLSDQPDLEDLAPRE